MDSGHRRTRALELLCGYASGAPRTLTAAQISAAVLDS
ncbi:MAG: hypothetical protein QOE80_1435 [Actinomycetota bacterium]|jgi:hypothetical protein|nr:hypothetical protein [Actinomycetota bacterium]